ncbi:BA75_02258T0 [Komagataella pastoris]|uniref:BA75_02258T0 n=1 Tax=Komagataella pastoris TaxID=4922 RepID=A0A1B2JBM0_PICPA|nr:BA75_02258T0 [Komagataella pastoris]
MKREPQRGLDPGLRRPSSELESELITSLDFQGREEFELGKENDNVFETDTNVQNEPFLCRRDSRQCPRKIRKETNKFNAKEIRSSQTYDLQTPVDNEINRPNIIGNIDAGMPTNRQESIEEQQYGPAPHRSYDENQSTRFTDHQSRSKVKVAPRSSLQFKVGPQFTRTFLVRPIYSNGGRLIIPKIEGRIDRGFEFLNNEWIGYKRNYFTLVAAFQFENYGFEEFTNATYHTIDQENNNLAIMYFALRLTSKCTEDGTSISLVQHTAKRDRGPQFEPPIHPAVPGSLPTHQVIKEAANIRNVGKIQRLNKLFYHNREESLTMEPGLNKYPENSIFKVARYERIQFASSINYRKPSSSTRRFNLYVELIACLENNEFVTLALIETPPLIIRGRSPSNYPNSKTSNEPASTKNECKQTKKSIDDCSVYTNTAGSFQFDSIDSVACAFMSCNAKEKEDEQINTFNHMSCVNEYLNCTNSSKIVAGNIPSVDSMTYPGTKTTKRGRKRKETSEQPKMKVKMKLNPKVAGKSKQIKIAHAKRIDDTVDCEETRRDSIVNIESPIQNLQINSPNNVSQGTTIESEPNYNFANDNYFVYRNKLSMLSTDSEDLKKDPELAAVLSHDAEENMAPRSLESLTLRHLIKNNQHEHQTVLKDKDCYLPDILPSRHSAEDCKISILVTNSDNKENLNPESYDNSKEGLFMEHVDKFQRAEQFSEIQAKLESFNNDLFIPSSSDTSRNYLINVFNSSPNQDHSHSSIFENELYNL